jgi:hypothetical protein
MSYGHAERNLALIRQLEAETRQLFGSLAQSEQEQQLPEPHVQAVTEGAYLLAVPRGLPPAPIADGRRLESGFDSRDR